MCNVSPKYHCQCVSQLLRKNFEHKCDQVANFQDITFEKTTVKVIEVVFIQVLFLATGSKHKR